MHAWMAHTLSYLTTPIAAMWVGHHEVVIRCTGRKLSLRELAHCRRLGIRQPENIRIKIVPRVPSPVPSWIEQLCQAIGFPVGAAAGICFRYGIYIDQNYSGNIEIVFHELVHTMQYERLGSLNEFLRQYIFECLHYGYHDSPLEIEAREKA